MTAPTGRLPGWLPAVNVLVKGLQRLGLPLGTIQILTVPGRRSGAPQNTPVSPLTVDGQRYVIAGLPQSDWARNVRAAGRGVLRQGRRATAVELHEVQDPVRRRAVVSAFPREVPRGVPFFVRLGLVEHGTPEEFAAISDRVAVFQISPASPDGAAPA